MDLITKEIAIDALDHLREYHRKDTTATERLFYANVVELFIEQQSESVASDTVELHVSNGQTWKFKKDDLIHTS